MRLATLALVTLLVRPALAVLPQLVIGTGTPAVVGGIPVAPQDLVRCALDAVGAGASTCHWSPFFDGKAAGLQTSIGALDVLPDGSLVMRVDADGAVQGLSGLTRTDIARFIPDAPFKAPYTKGRWERLLDGKAVAGADGARVWTGVSVLADGACEHSSPMTSAGKVRQ